MLKFSRAVKLIYYALLIVSIGLAFYYAKVPAEDGMALAKRYIGLGRLGLFTLLFSIIHHFASDYVNKQKVEKTRVEQDQLQILDRED